MRSNFIIVLSIVFLALCIVVSRNFYSTTKRLQRQSLDLSFDIMNLQNQVTKSDFAKTDTVRIPVYQEKNFQNFAFEGTPTSAGSIDVTYKPKESFLSAYDISYANNDLKRVSMQRGDLSRFSWSKEYLSARQSNLWMQKRLEEEIMILNDTITALRQRLKKKNTHP